MFLFSLFPLRDLLGQIYTLDNKSRVILFQHAWDSRLLYVYRYIFVYLLTESFFLKQLNDIKNSFIILQPSWLGQ